MATDTLRNARVAFEDGLINAADFEAVKVAFLKAQQYKAGLDAGFITPTDYAEVKARFLDDVAALSVSGSNSAAGGGPAPSGRSTGEVSAANGATHSGPPSPSRGPSADGYTPPPSPPPAMAADGTAAVPTNIPRMGGTLRKNNGPSVSMSGISVSEDAVNLFYYMKAKSTYRWAMWRINDAGTEIIITAVGPKDSTYEQFLAALPENEPRFAVYDYQVTNSEGRLFNKLVFFSWSPDTSRVKAKMMYASTKDFFKSYLEGLAVELQASEMEDITEKDINDAVISVLTRK